MSIIGKIHEISFYGLIVTIIGFVKKAFTKNILLSAAFHVCDFKSLFLAYLFWASVLYIPIATIGAFATKYGDEEGLYFDSDNLLVIFFAHIAEEILGLVSTPFWFLKDLFTQELDDGWKIFDYVTYTIELVFIAVGIIAVF